jgi:hypothetical protein
MATPFTSQISKVYLLTCSIILHFAINFQRYAASLKIYDLFRIKLGAASLNHPYGTNSIDFFHLRLRQKLHPTNLIN